MQREAEEFRPVVPVVVLERRQPVPGSEDDVDTGQSAVVLGCGVQDRRSAAPGAQQHRGGLPVHGKGDRDGAAGSDVELVLEQVGGLGHPVVQRRGREFDSLPRGVVVVGEQRPGRITEAGGGEQPCRAGR
jgi:hypothetical protein